MYIFVVRLGLQRNDAATMWFCSLKIHLYLCMSFGTQIRTAIIITTWEEYAISYFQIFVVTIVNVLRIIFGWNCELTTIWLFRHLSKYVCSIHLTESFYVRWNVLQNEMHAREWHANIIGRELYMHRQYNFFFLPCSL